MTGAKVKKYPVTEIFGPTIQGEGVDQGVPCYFIRFGGCDYSCHWCDTPHAVLPEMVRHANRMTEDEILDALSLLPEGPSLVVLSGGNPALHELGGLCERIQRLGLRISVETQATRYKEWLRHVERLCLSPKPPSSEMAFRADVFADFLVSLLSGRRQETIRDHVFAKVVVFDYTDYEWAVNLYTWMRSVGYTFPFYLSVGNDAGRTVGNPSRVDERSIDQVRNDLLTKYLWLINRTMVDPRWNGEAVVQAQAHVLAWGNKIGV